MIIRSVRIRLLTVDGHPFRGCHVILKGRYFTCVVACHLRRRQIEIESAVTVVRIRAVLIVQIDAAFHHANSLNKCI